MIEFNKKHEDLKREFSEKRDSLEEAFVERSKKLGAMIKEQDDELQYLKTQVSMAKGTLNKTSDKITEKTEKSTTWKNISSLNPIKGRKTKNN